TGASLWHYDMPLQTNSGHLKRCRRMASVVAAPLLGFPSGLPLLAEACRQPFDHLAHRPQAPAILCHAAALQGGGPRAIAVIGAYQAVVGLDVRTGQPVWPLRELERPLSALSPRGEQAVTARAGDNGVQVVTVSLATGECLWKQTTQGDVGVSSDA